MKRISTAILALGATLAAHAAIIPIHSDLVSEGNNRDGTNDFIAVHSLWQPNNPAGSPAQWISYRNDTGGNAPGFVEPNVPNPIVGGGANAPSAIFWEEFTVTSAGSGSVTVWADDTTRVLLGATLLFEANPVQDGACAQGPIACQPPEGQLINFVLPGAGTYRLNFETYQRASGPFGLLYTGQVEHRGTGIEETPEPATYALLGAGLLALGVLRRRRA